MSSKRGRRSKYTAEEYFIILREEAAAKIHIAPYRKKLELFQTAAETVSGNEKCTVEPRQKAYSTSIPDYGRTSTRMIAKRACSLDSVGR